MSVCYEATQTVMEDIYTSMVVTIAVTSNVHVTDGGYVARFVVVN